MDIQSIVISLIALFQLILLPIGKYFFTRIRDNELQNQEFKLEVAKDYVTKNDMKEHVSTHLASIEDKINSLETLIKQSLNSKHE